MKEFKKRYIVRGMERMVNTLWGNPRWELQLVDEEDQTTIWGTTTPNVSCAYSMGAHMIGKMYEFEAHYTASGNLRIDYYHS